MKIQRTLFLCVYTLMSCANVEETLEKPVEVKTEKRVEVKERPDGEFIQKYPNGNIKIKGEIHNNERVGLWIAYYENGMKQSESTYQKSILHGRTASFYKNGQVRYIGYFFGGKKDGKWELYTEDGKLEKTETYVKGVSSK